MPPMAADWLITSIHDRGATDWYRWRIEGVNTNHAPDGAGRIFAWSVPAICDRRYAVHPEASGATASAVASAKQWHRFCQHACRR